MEPELIAILGDAKVDALGLNPPAIHALWALKGLGAIEGPGTPARAAVLAALKHPSAGVRRNALQVLPADARAPEQALAADALDDADPQVRLAALLALADLPASEAAGAALARALVAGKVADDPLLGDALTAAAAKQDRAFLASLATHKFGPRGGNRHPAVVARVAEHYARGVPADTVGSLLDLLADGDPAVAGAIVVGLDRGWPRDRPAKLDDAAEAALGTLVAKLPAGFRGRLVGLATRMGSKGLEKYTAEIVGTFLATARDEAKPEDERVAAAKQLIDFRKADADAAKELLRLVTPRTDPTLAAGLIDAVGRSESPAVGPALAEAFPALTPRVRPAAARALVGRTDWTAALLDAVEAGKIRIDELALDQAQALAAHPDKALAARAKALLARGGGLPDADRQKVIDALGPVVLKGGDADRGKAVFTQNCAKCHTYAGEGGKVGPELTGMASHHPPGRVARSHILDPSRSIEGNYTQYALATTDGRVHERPAGLRIEAPPSSWSTPRGRSTPMLRERHRGRWRPQKKSLMPEGFEKQLGPDGNWPTCWRSWHRPRQVPPPGPPQVGQRSSAPRGMFFDPDERAPTA